jgi:hypothetical protein
LLFAAWTLFSVFIYSRYSQLGDSDAYLSGAYDDSGQARTVLITLLAVKLAALLKSTLLVHLAFSMFAASGVAYLARQAHLRRGGCVALWAIVLNPDFGVWASVIGRESLFVGLLGFFTGALLAYYRRRTLMRWLLAIACLGGMFFVRSAYGTCLAIFLVAFVAYALPLRSRLSVGVQACVAAALLCSLLVPCWSYVDTYLAGDVLPKAKSYFTLASATTRAWMSLDTSGQLFGSLWWLMPLSLLGPTPTEVYARPMMLPFMAAGMVLMVVLIHGIYIAFRASLPGRARKILLLGWLPATLLLLISYVPFGVYNPGSGIRYLSCFVLFFAFPSLFRSMLQNGPNTSKHAQGARP